ncbi:MAG TPA: insulinase family protein, partial [Candidatus Polarisedimenticolia bacterium]|nr:insulinase family protein [Candidatus Polarisedimenticolia bacterium]
MLLAAVLAAALAGGSAGAGETTKMERTPETAGRSEVSLSLLPIPASPLLTFRIEFRVGSIDDPRGKEGLNALTALTIGQGGTKDLTYREVTDRLYPMAASIHAQPDREVTTFVGEVHRDHLRGFYQILTDLILKPRFDPADFGRVRDNLVAQLETNLRGSDDEGLGKETLNWMMYEGLPAGHPNIGTVQGLKGITLEEVKAFYGAHYTRDQM